MLIRRVLFALLLGYNSWSVSASEDSLITVTVELLKTINDKLVTLYVPDEDTCPKDYRDVTSALMQKNYVFQSGVIVKGVVIEPYKHVFIIGCSKFIQNLWWRLSPKLKPSNTVAVISRDYAGTGKFIKLRSHVGIRLIVVTQRKDDTWIVRRTFYTPDRAPHYEHLTTMPGNHPLTDEFLFPVPKFHGWTIRFLVKRVKKATVYCKGWHLPHKTSYQHTLWLLLRDYLKVCYKVRRTRAIRVGHFRKRRWSGALGVLQRNRTDIAGRIFVINPQRASHFDMAEWFDLGKVNMIGAGSSIIVKPFLIFEVFTPSLWLFTGCCIIVLAYLRWMVAALEFKVLSTVKKDPVVRKRSRVFYYMQTFSMLVWRGIPETRSEERMWGLRVSTVTTSMMVFILMAVYCNNITSFISVPQTNKPINTLDDLFARPDVIPMIRPGNSHYRYIYRSDTSAMKKLQELITSNGEKASVELYSREIAPLCATGKRVYIASQSYCKFIMKDNSNLTLHISSESLKWDLYSLGMQKDGPYSARVYMGLKRIKEFGLMVYINKLSEVKPRPIESSQIIFGLLHLQGAFYIWSVGSAVSIMCFIAEICVRKKKKRDTKT